jgi:large subunit ribosomal protein L4
MQLPVKNIKGEQVGTIEVNDSLVAVPMNAAVVHQALVMYQANGRQGTHDAKTRTEVSGGGRKPWRQKYTGRARQGSIRAPQWRHGGVAFGPKPRDYRQDMPARMRHLAMKCVLSERVRQGKLVVLENLSLPETKTKAMADVFKALQIKVPVLVITRGPEHNVVLACRNIEKVWTLPVDQLNAAELLRRATVLITADAIKRAEELWAVEKNHRKVEAKA